MKNIYGKSNNQSIGVTAENRDEKEPIQGFGSRKQSSSSRNHAGSA